MRVVVVVIVMMMQGGVLPWFGSSYCSSRCWRGVAIGVDDDRYSWSTGR